MTRRLFAYCVTATAIALTTIDLSHSQAAPIPANTFAAVAAQRIDSDEGGFPSDLLEPGDRFGRSVITIGDLDLDGVKDLVVGARSDDDGGVDAGAAYILFMNADLTVKSATKISATTGGLGAGVLDAGDFFGYSLASSGDLNNDGIQDLSVGAPNDDDGNIDSGASASFFDEFADVTSDTSGLTYREWWGRRHPDGSVRRDLIPGNPPSPGSVPLDIITSYTKHGDVKTVTTYDQFGRPYRQYGVNEGHPFHYHTYSFPTVPQRGTGVAPIRSEGIEY